MSENEYDWWQWFEYGCWAGVVLCCATVLSVAVYVAPAINGNQGAESDTIGVIVFGILFLPWIVGPICGVVTCTTVGLVRLAILAFMQRQRRL